MESLTVSLGTRSYPIRIGFELFESLLESTHLNRERRSGRKCALVVDAAILESHEDLINEAFHGAPRWTMPRGEASKSMATAEKLLDFLAHEQMDRGSFLIAVGGGVAGDLAGFCAAIFLRGIEFYQIPTTLLAMVDSSVGGKTGVNLSSGKNLVGAFKQPQAVCSWVPFLQSLPAKEFSSGMAEVIKYGLLADEDLFHLLEKSGELSPDSPSLESVIRRCCEIKAEIVSQDEREEAADGGRALLNLGHTFAHAIEKTAGFGEYLHGEAVAIGVQMAAEFSAQSGMLAPESLPRIQELLRKNGLPTTLRSPLSVNQLLDAMSRDKKVRSGKIRLVLLERIGSAVTQEIGDSRQLADLWAQFGAGV